MGWWPLAGSRIVATTQRPLPFLLVLLVLGVLGPPTVRADAMAPVTIEDRSLRAGGERFVAYGFNYGADKRGGTLRYFDHPNDRRWHAVRNDLDEARRIGANTLRVFLEIGQFMNSAQRARPRALRALERLLSGAERKGLYIDVTGNLAWRADHRDAWYDDLGERQRWRVQARFWRAVAERGRPFESVLCYELTSEPAVPTAPSASWYFGGFGGFDFGQFIVRDLRDRDPYQVAREWTVKLRSAVRSRDRRHPVTIGLLPSGLLPSGQLLADWAFDPANVASTLDLLIVHDYPAEGQAKPSIDRMRYFAGHARPVLLGETSQLSDGPETQRRFLLGSRSYLDGFLTFFDGRRPPEVEPETISDAIYLANLRQFLALRPLLAH